MAGIHYRRRLRSRIIISFALFGLSLTALFAVATFYMRARIEDQVINNNLEHEVKKFVDFKREHPEPDARYTLNTYDLDIKSKNFFANVPFARQKYDSGVYDIQEYGDEGKLRPYKLAVYKADNYWAFLRYDVSTQKLGERQLLTGLMLAAAAFAVLSLLIGRWLSARVMSPVTDLAQRVQAMSRTGKPEELGIHFANDEVGQLAAALDSYSDKLTALVDRDRHDHRADARQRRYFRQSAGTLKAHRTSIATIHGIDQRAVALVAQRTLRTRRRRNDGSGESRRTSHRRLPFASRPQTDQCETRRRRRHRSRRAVVRGRRRIRQPDRQRVQVHAAGRSDRHHRCGSRQSHRRGHRARHQSRRRGKIIRTRHPRHQHCGQQRCGPRFGHRAPPV